MDTINLKNRVEKTIEKDGVSKCLIKGEVENGYVIIKRRYEEPESGEEEPTRVEEVYVYKEDPTGDKKDMSIEDGLESLLDNYM